MKRKLARFLTLLLALSICLSASADTPQYDTTIAFAEVLGYEDVLYDYLGVDEENNAELISLTFDDMDYDTFAITVIFVKDSTDVGLCAWDLITVGDSVDDLTLLQAVNQLNYDYPYGKFYVDPTDRTITCEMTVDLSYSSDPGRSVFEGLRILAGLLYDDTVSQTLLSLK
ncbi:MAG: YbjN domain-containing protein [Clostridia bacterium]|nr:YbjN domain-containing protein [Clostridia bacterium]